MDISAAFSIYSPSNRRRVLILAAALLIVIAAIGATVDSGRVTLEAANA
jgi:hypothetical protein